MRKSASVVGLLGGVMIAAAGCGDDLRAASPADGELAAAATAVVPLAPVVLATAPEQDRLYDLALADGNVYFGGGVSIPPPPDSSERNDERGVVRRVPAGGGAVQEIWTGEGQVNDLAVGGGTVFFLAYDFTDRTGRLERVAASGGDAAELGNWFSHGSTHSLALDAQTVFWTHSAGASSFVIRTSGVDGTSTMLADSSTIGSSAGNILFDRGTLYFGSNGSTVFKLAADGASPPVVLFSPGTEITALAVAPAGDALYAGYADPADPVRGAIARIDLTAAPVKTRQLTGTATRVLALAADARFVYFGVTPDAAGNGQLGRIGARGGPARVLLTGAFTPASLTLDATSLYWLDATGRTVNKAAR